MNFDEIVPEFIFDNEVKFAYTNMPRDWENWDPIAAGYVYFFIEFCTNIKINYLFLNKSWINDDWTKLKLLWII